MAKIKDLDRRVENRERERERERGKERKEEKGKEGVVVEGEKTARQK